MSDGTEVEVGISQVMRGVDEAEEEEEEMDEEFVAVLESVKVDTPLVVVDDDDAVDEAIAVFCLLLFSLTFSAVTATE